jgi:hypothetical protein
LVRWFVGCQVTANGSWRLCFGQNGRSDPSSPNLELALTSSADVQFIFDTTTKICTAGSNPFFILFVF